MVEQTLFRSVDVGVFVAALTDRLRGAGIAVGLSSSRRLAESLAVCPATDPTTMYWVTRACLVNDPHQIERFDAVFEAVFAGDGLPIRPKERNFERPPPAPTATGKLLRNSAPTDGMAEAAGRFDTSFRPEIGETSHEVDDESDREQTEIPEIFPAAVAALADEPFDRLSDEDLDCIGVWLEQQMSAFPLRRSRRRQPARSGSIDMRRTIAAARSTAGEPVLLAASRPRLKPRRVVMVGDVSGSMESFTRIYLHLMRALVVKGNAEVFTFSTQLRRVTVQLRDRDPQAAIDRLSSEVTDRFSGTRIATSLADLAQSPVWANSVRGATVLISSDGWDTDEPEHLARAMRRLARLSYRIVWVNPRSAADGFAPSAGGMAAALPWVDAFFSGHSLRSIQHVIEEIALG